MTFPDAPGVLRACSDALAGARLRPEAAVFGELSLPDADPWERLEVAWRSLYAGRADAALAVLDEVPDDAHPLAPVVRAAALAARARTPDALAGLLRVVATRPPGAVSLHAVVIGALAVGDRGVALDAAARYLATVDGDDPEMRGLAAPGQALDGDLAAAVTSTEWSAAGRVADRDGAIRATVDELRRGGHDGVAYRFLAEGYHRTGRFPYGALLAEVLPRRVRNRDRRITGGVAAMFGGFGVLVAGVSVVPLALAGGLISLAGIGTALSGMLLRAPGCTRTATTRICNAWSRYRNLSGSADPVQVAALAVGAVLGFGALFGRDRATERFPIAAFPVLVVAAVAAAALAVGATLAHRRWRRRGLAAAEQAARIDGTRCRCWERTLFAGPDWRTYLGTHLHPAATGGPLDATLLRCPVTAKDWLHLPGVDVTVTVRLPVEEEPGPGTELPSGAYL